MNKVVQGNSSHPVVGYLAPEIPALSATFVYDEIHALERRGFTVAPFAVHRSENIAAAEHALLGRTRVLYAGHPLLDALRGLRHLLMHRRRLGGALRWLVRDIQEGRSLSAAAKLLVQFLAGARLASALKRQGCAHLHIHFAHVPTQIGMYAATLANLPFTVTAHANDIFERGFLLARKAERALKIFCISDFNQQFLLSQGLPQHKLTVVRCGVSFAAVDRKPARQRDRIRIGTLGRMVDKKGFDVLIRAFSLLAKEHGEMELSIAGDGPLRDELRQLTQELGLTSRVVFEGALAHRQVAGWMQSLDMFVLACKRDPRGDMDGIPVVLMEAMSQSVPVISTRLSGIPELVKHECTGLLAEPGDSVSLAMQMRRLLSDPVLMDNMVGQARQHVVAEFGQDVNIERLLVQAALHRTHQ
jgi:glycosyltransferase involved in cell wall biosynthesis